LVEADVLPSILRVGEKHNLHLLAASLDGVDAGSAPLIVTVW
jgi:hypothetical protein